MDAIFRGMNFDGFLDIFAYPFGHVMRFFNWICGGHYALALILFALAVKLLLLPLGIKQQKTQIKMAALRPKMALIEKKYAGRYDRVTQQKKQQEIMELQRKEGVSPFAGCLPLLIQLPVIMGLFQIIRYPLKYVCNLSNVGILALCNGVSAPNAQFATFEALESSADYAAMNINIISGLRAGTITMPPGFEDLEVPNLTLFGHIDLSYVPSSVLSCEGDCAGGKPINLLLLLIPVLCTALSFLTTWVTRKLNDNGLNAATAAASPDQKTPMGMMNIIMPMMTGVFAFITQGVIGLYWVYSSIFGILQILLLAKIMPMPKYTPAEIKEILKSMKQQKDARNIPSTRVDENGKPKSLHYEDDDENY